MLSNFLILSISISVCCLGRTVLSGDLDLAPTVRSKVGSSNSPSPSSSSSISSSEMMKSLVLAALFEDFAAFFFLLPDDLPFPVAAFFFPPFFVDADLVVALFLAAFFLPVVVSFALALGRCPGHGRGFGLTCCQGFGHGHDLYHGGGEDHRHGLSHGHDLGNCSGRGRRLRPCVRPLPWPRQ